MIRAVIFDIDNTLYNFDSCHAVAWKALCDYVWEHLHMSAEEFARCHQEAAKVMNARLGISCGSVHNRLLRYQILLEENGFSIRHALPMSEIYWNTLFSEIRPEPGAVECIRKLKADGYILGIGTDMTVDYQFRKLQDLQLLPYFDFIVSSEEVMAEKPDQRLFRCCIQKAGVTAQECLYVGDNFQKDVLGAQNAGMGAVWYCPDAGKASEHPDYRSIRHFDEIVNILSES